MRRGQVTQPTDRTQNMTNNMPMETQRDTMSRQNDVEDIKLELKSLRKCLESLLGPNPSNGQFARAYEAPPLSPTPTPCAQNVPACLEYPTIEHLHADQTYHELTVPDDPFADNDHFANTSHPVVPQLFAMDLKPTQEDNIGNGKKKGKTVKKTKKGAKKAENIMDDESSTFSGEPEIQYPKIQHAPRDGSTANRLDSPQVTQFIVHVKSPSTPSRVIIEF